MDVLEQSSRQSGNTGTFSISKEEISMRP